MKPAFHAESNIPILTEIIDPQQLAALTQPTTSQVTSLSADDLEQLEKTLRESILRQLLTRVDFVLEHRVRDSLADVLQTAVDHLAEDIRKGLSKSHGDAGAVETAVHQNLTTNPAAVPSLRPAFRQN